MHKQIMDTYVTNYDGENWKTNSLLDSQFELDNIKIYIILKNGALNRQLDIRLWNPGGQSSREKVGIYQEKKK